MKPFYYILSLCTALLYATQTSAVDYTSVQTGNWDSSSTWDVSGLEGQRVIIGGNKVTISSTDTVYLAGNLTVAAGAELVIDGVLSMVGDFTNVAAGVITINGTFLVDGNLENWGFFTSSDVGVGVDGYVGVTGDVDNYGGAGSFINDGTVVAGGTISGVTGSGSTVEYDSDPLPIELISFTSALIANTVYFEWLTASETNNDYFTIEQSTDGVNWEIITTEFGAGNSMEVLSYSYEHALFESGYYYYRLKQTDYNGDYSYSDITALQFESTQLANQAKAVVKNGQVNLIGDFSQVSVYDINGSKWGDYRASFSANELPVNRLLVFVFDNTHSQKLLITHQ